MFKQDWTGWNTIDLYSNLSTNRAHETWYWFLRTSFQVDLFIQNEFIGISQLAVNMYRQKFAQFSPIYSWVRSKTFFRFVNWFLYIVDWFLYIVDFIYCWPTFFEYGSYTLIDGPYYDSTDERISNGAQFFTEQIAKSGELCSLDS